MLIPDDILEQAISARNTAVKERNAALGSTWTVTRRTGQFTTDPTTGDATPVTQTVWSGNAKFRPGGRPVVKTRADAALTIEQPTLCVAHDVTPFRNGDTITCTASRGTSLIGRTWLVTGEPDSSNGTDRHYPLEEVT